MFSVCNDINNDSQFRNLPFAIAIKRSVFSPQKKSNIIKAGQQNLIPLIVRTTINSGIGKVLMAQMQQIVLLYKDGAMQIGLVNWKNACSSRENLSAIYVYIFI